MKTENKEIGSIQKMEQHILKEVSYITDVFLRKGLINVVVEQLKSSRLFVLLTFKDGNRFTRIRVSVDKDLFYNITVVNHDKDVIFASRCKYDSDFNATLYMQCSGLADLPF